MILLLTISVTGIVSISIVGAENIAANKMNFTAIKTGTELDKNVSLTETAVAKTTEQAFKVGPTVRLLSLNSEINKSSDGLVEVFLDNPTLNDMNLEVDMEVDVPSDIYIYAQDGSMAGGAGTVIGHFSVPPGSSRTIYLHVIGKKVGTFPIHFGGMSWTGNNKNNWNSISIENSFDVTEPSEIPVTALPPK